MRTNGARSRGREGGGRGEGGGNNGRQAALAAQWEDYPMPGLVAAAAAGWTEGSALWWSSSSSSRSPFLYHRQTSTDKEAEDRQHRVQAGTFKNNKKKEERKSELGCRFQQ